MIRNRCRVCDSIVGLGGICPVCKKHVQTYETNENYYLNERHGDMEMEAHCEYHHPDQGQEMSLQPKAFKTENLTPKPFVVSDTFKTGKKSKKAKGTVVVFIIVAIWLLMCCCGIVPSLLHW